MKVTISGTAEHCEKVVKWISEKDGRRDRLEAALLSFIEEAVNEKEPTLGQVESLRTLPQVAQVLADLLKD